MTDDRAGLVSASKFEIVACCPGSVALETAIGKPENIIELPDPDAESGTRIHKARETADISQLSPEEVETYQRGMSNEMSIFNQWVNEFNVSGVTTHLEKRIWLHWPDMSPATSARLDVHFVSADHVAVVEWKTLWCHNLTPAERNWQGRVQAVCAAKEYGARHVRVAFNKALFGKSDVVDYNESDLVYAEQSIFQKLWEAQQPHASRNPGPWCNFCVCKPYCREAAAYSLVPAKLGENPVEMVALLPHDDLATIQQKASVIKKVLEAVQARLKSLTAEELKAVGLYIDDGKKLDPISDVAGAFKALQDVGIPRPVIWSALQMKKGALTEAVRELKGWTKPATDDWLWQNLLKPFIEKKQSEGSLQEL